MWRHYLRSAWRNIKKGRLYSVINIAGLSVGLATGMMLLLWVQNETGFDSFLAHSEQIYRVNTHFKGQENAGKEIVYAKTPPSLSPVAKSIPAVLAACRVIDDGRPRFEIAGQGKSFRLSALFVDSSFLSVFSYQLLEGERSALWRDPHSIVLTASVAKKIYGNAEALGRVLNYDGHLMNVTGILADFPKNATLRSQVLLPVSYYAADFAARHKGRSLDENRQNFGMSTFLLLQKEADINKVAAVFTRNWTDMGDHRFEFRLQHLTDVHLIAPNGDKSAYRLVQMFMVIVGMLFLIACINYINISTARSLSRARDVGIQKIMGARRIQLFYQFIWETVLVFGISLAIAIGMIYLLMPLYDYIAGSELRFGWKDWQKWKALLFVLAAALVVASIYPALLLSSFKPLASLKGKISRNTTATACRRGLVVFQFFMAAVLLFVTIVMGRQLEYIRTVNIGYDKDYVFTVSFPKAAAPHLAAIKERLTHNSSIAGIGLSNAENLTNLTVSTTGIRWKGKDPDNSFFIYPVSVDHSFIDVMKMQLEKGHNFTGRPVDSAGLILNRTAIEQMGLKAPYLGQEVQLGANKCVITGIVRDFNFQSLKSAVSPLVFYVHPKLYNTLYVRTSARQMKAAIAAVAAAYQPYKTNDQPFSYHFLDQQFEDLYRSDRQAGALFTSFASIAVFISCLGLLGLATYSAEARIKEIGIRKVLGAGAGRIVRLICKEFVALVILAILISAPVSYLLAGKWLHGFAYQAPVGIGVLAEVLCLLLLISVMIIGLKVYKAATANLLVHLKSE